MAEFYDLLHMGLPDVEAYVSFGRRYGPGILELGSGSGRILIPLARAGFEVTGIDRSDDMMARLKAKMAYEPCSVQSRLRNKKADITCFDLHTSFDLIIAPCNLFNHLPEPDQVRKTLTCVKGHLKDSGTFIVDFSIPNVEFMASVNGRERVFEFIHPIRGTRIVDRFTVHYDFVKQLQREHIVVEEYDGKTLLQRAECRQTMTYYFPRELRILIEGAGLAVFHTQGSLLEDVPVTAESGEMVFFCKKA